MADIKLTEEERKARNQYMRVYRQTERGKKATARANKRYWKKKAAELEEENKLQGV